MEKNEAIEAIKKIADKLTEKEAKDIIKNLVDFIVEHEDDYNRENSTKESKLVSVGFAITGGHLFNQLKITRK